MRPATPTSASGLTWPDGPVFWWRVGPVPDVPSTGYRPIGPSGGDEPALDEAVSARLAGWVVAIPTDTVYGLAVDPSRPGATALLFALKHRPATFELPVL